MWIFFIFPHLSCGEILNYSTLMKFPISLWMSCREIWNFSTWQIFPHRHRLLCLWQIWGVFTGCKNGNPLKSGVSRVDHAGATSTIEPNLCWLPTFWKLELPEYQLWTWELHWRVQNYKSWYLVWEGAISRLINPFNLHHKTWTWSKHKLKLESIHWH